MSFESPSQIQAFDWQKLFLSFEGRTRRSHFWVGWLILLGVGVVAGWIPVLGFLISLALIWPNLAITVKRLHDMGRSGWFVLIPVLVNLVGGIIAAIMIGVGVLAQHSSLEAEDPFAFFAIMAPAFGIIALIALLDLIFLLWIGVTDGQRGDNRFGPDPKDG